MPISFNVYLITNSFIIQILDVYFWGIMSTLIVGKRNGVHVVRRLHHFIYLCKDNDKSHNFI